VGDDVISGCINLNGVIKVQTTKTFKQSTVSKILDLVENSQNRKSKSENFIKKFAKVYTPIVCALALIIAVVVPVVSIFVLNLNTDWFTWIYRALTFLVISCPCALVIGIPLSFFAGIGGASREGVLIKGSTFIEVLSKLKYIAFDKTGTLTKGVFKVITVHHNTMPKSKLIEYAAYAESASTHPIALSILSAYGKEIKASRVCEINQTAGKGISAKVDGKVVLAGNSKFMEANNVEYSECSYAGTIVHVAIDGVHEGHIVISDELKPNSKAAIEELKKLHVKKIVMLTGDSPRVAQQVAESLKIDEYYAGLLPDDKVSKLEELKSKKSNGEMLGFVGDGINDAPVLAIADVGVAMGGVGSDAALEAADVVLMNDEPKQIAKAIKISNKCMRIVRENIVFAIGVKVICLILGAVGIADMWLAIFADVGVMIICVLNAIRALRVHNL
jgi:Zn2+/Cd2+-exporting ATPase